MASESDMFTIKDVIDAIEAQITGEPVENEDEKLIAAANLLRSLYTAHWISAVSDENGETIAWGCSRCKKLLSLSRIKMQYCPNCGAKMEVDE